MQPMEDDGRKPAARIWDPMRTIDRFPVDASEYDSIMGEFIRKVEATQEERPFVPNADRDAFNKVLPSMSELDLTNKAQRQELFNSLNMQGLRRHSKWFLQYSRDLLEKRKMLIGIRRATEDEDTGMCLDEIVKKMQTDMEYINIIRDKIAELLSIGDMVAHHYSTCINVVKTKK